MAQVRIRRGTGKGRRLMDEEDQVGENLSREGLTVLGSVAGVVADGGKVGRESHRKKANSGVTVKFGTLFSHLVVVHEAGDRGAEMDFRRRIVRRRS